MDPVEERGGPRCYGIMFLVRPRIPHQKALLGWSLLGDVRLKVKVKQRPRSLNSTIICVSCLMTPLKMGRVSSHC